MAKDGSAGSVHEKETMSQKNSKSYKSGEMAKGRDEDKVKDNGKK